MKKFKATVIKTYEYEIELDDNVWTSEEITNWASVFQEVSGLEDFAKSVAIMKSKYENGEFMEGFGIPYINGKAPYVRKDDESSLSPDININVIEDGDDCPYVVVEEM